MGIASSPYTKRRRSVRGPRMLGALGLEGMKKTLLLLDMSQNRVREEDVPCVWHGVWLVRRI